MSNTELESIKKHPKQDFQVERLAFFSDAVFAIAITLLVIEIKVPHITPSSTAENIRAQLDELKPQLISLLLSFALISIYWIRHHLLFKYIHNYNDKIVVINLIALFPIIFFPFTTAFLAESINNPVASVIAMRLFCLNHILAGVVSYVLFWFVIVKHKEFSFDMLPLEKAKIQINTLFLAILFSIVLLVSFITNNKNILFWTIIVLGVGKRVVEKYYKRTKKD